MKNQKFTLKVWRVYNNWTQKEIAKRIGVSVATYCSWEKGKSFPGTRHIAKICDVLGVSYDNIIFLHKVSLKANPVGHEVEE